MKRSAWRRNIASAALCDELANLRGVPREDAFLCGLLHDYGRLIAVSSLEEILAAMPEVGVRPLAFWESLAERRRVELGTLLATKWRLPKVFQEVMAVQYADGAAGTGPNAKMVDLVAASVAEERPQPSKAAVAETTLEEGFRRVELTLHQLKPRKRGPYTVRGIGSGASYPPSSPGALVRHDTVPPRALCFVEGAVGDRDELGQVFRPPCLRRRRQTERDRNRDGCSLFAL
jgi:hypothetical protein